MTRTLRPMSICLGCGTANPDEARFRLTRGGRLAMGSEAGVAPAAALASRAASA